MTLRRYVLTSGCGYDLAREHIKKTLVGSGNASGSMRELGACTGIAKLTDTGCYNRHPEPLANPKDGRASLTVLPRLRLECPHACFPIGNTTSSMGLTKR
jgi:hypothetical protein